MCNSEGHIEAEENSEAQAKTHPALTEQKLESSLLESKKLDDNELWEYVYCILIQYTLHIHSCQKIREKMQFIFFFQIYISLWFHEKINLTQVSLDMNVQILRGLTQQ